MSASQLATLNPHTPLVDQQGNATRYLTQYMRERDARIESSAFATPGQIVQYSAQAAAIVTAALVASTSAPLYRIGYDLRISLAGGVSSAAQVTIGWTEGGVSQTRVGSNVNGNTTTSTDSLVCQIRPDAGTVITYAVSYASAGVPAMEFSFDIVGEAIG